MPVTLQPRVFLASGGGASTTPASHVTNRKAISVLACRGLIISRVATQRLEQEAAPTRICQMQRYCQRRMIMEEQGGPKGHRTTGVWEVALSGGDGGVTGGGPQPNDETDSERYLKYLHEHALNIVGIHCELFTLVGSCPFPYGASLMHRH